VGLAREMYDRRDRTVQQIADALGVSRVTVYHTWTRPRADGQARVAWRDQILTSRWTRLMVVAKPMRRREVNAALRKNGCDIKNDDGPHTTWACPCG
jgi:predicted transcriptional regulator